MRNHRRVLWASRLRGADFLFREHLLALQGTVRAVNSEYQEPSFSAIPPLFAAGLLGQEPLEAEVDVRERRNPPLETEFFTISGPFLALLPKVNI